MDDTISFSISTEELSLIQALATEMTGGTGGLVLFFFW